MELTEPQRPAAEQNAGRAQGNLLQKAVVFFAGTDLKILQHD